MLQPLYSQIDNRVVKWVFQAFYKDIINENTSFQQFYDKWYNNVTSEISEMEHHQNLVQKIFRVSGTNATSIQSIKGPTEDIINRVSTMSMPHWPNQEAMMKKSKIGLIL